jgi:hypothetical protein
MILSKGYQNIKNNKELLLVEGSMKLEKNKTLDHMLFFKKELTNIFRDWVNCIRGKVVSPSKRKRKNEPFPIQIKDWVIFYKNKQKQRSKPCE